MSLADLLPDVVVLRAGAVDDPRWDALVSDVERAPVARAVPSRVRDFVAGRGCAHEALAALGIPGGPVAVGERRGPVWPAGVVGSITHGAGEVAAAVAHATDVAALGIDVEPLRVLPPEVAALVRSADERARLASSGLDDDTAALVLFSAKESVFKAWHPLRGTWIEFDHADVDLAADGSFTARVTSPGGGPGVVWAGRWEVDGAVVRTAVVVPA
ncbi:4'-phosphopantetheinyl transferase family protein [Solicola sp. PLA-1-18]|uniref:4'-phosphopantetheinyl transferase family protein n=1 Tax=Solicola sp. PLA-1-18 TaxID=3380532 RepID=UPI003B81BE70